MAGAGGLPGVANRDGDRIVLHVDMDCFYAACERLRDPSLVGEAVVVGMGFEPGEAGGAVATASYEAREYGVESAQPISEAMERLPPVDREDDGTGPRAHYRPVDMPYYREKAAEVRAILHEHAATVREVSIDEAYLDCTERVDWQEAEEYARRLKRLIATEVGLPVSIGVAPNMSVAKVASDHDKPDGLVVVTPDEVASFLAPLPVDALHGVGPVTAAELRDAGMEHVEDIATGEREGLVDRFGQRGRDLHRRARGIDPRAVTPRGEPKSLSRESAFHTTVSDQERVHERVVGLAEAVAERASNRGATYRTIGIKVVTLPFDIHTRERSLPGPVDDRDLVVDVATDLLGEFADERVRKVGVRVSNLSFGGGDQTDLASWSADGGAADDHDPIGHRHRGGQATLAEFRERE